MIKLFFSALMVFAAYARAVTLEWDANTETNVGYKVYIGMASRSYQTNFTTTNTSFTIANTNLFSSTNYFSVTAFYLHDPSMESEYSDEVFLTLTNRPLKVKNVRFSARLAVQSAPAVNGPWSQEPELGEVDLTPQSRFFRLALLPIAPASLFRPLRLEPTSGSRKGKLVQHVPSGAAPEYRLLSKSGLNLPTPP